MFIKKNIKEKTLERIESFMLFRTIICIFLLLAFAIKQNYFTSYNLLIILLVINSNIMSFINFRPRLLFNKLKLFKLRTKYGLISSLISSPISCFIAVFINPNLGYILLLVLNPIFIGLLMRLNLKLILPKFKLNFKFSFKQLIKKEFLNQLIETFDDFQKKLIIQDLPNLNESGIYLRNETFFYSPLKVINKSLERVVLASWGPARKIKRIKLIRFLLIISIVSILLFLSYLFKGAYISNLFLGNKWIMPANLFILASFIVIMKFIRINLSTLIKVKTKSFNFIFINSLIFVFFPIFLILIIGIKEIHQVILIYAISIALRNISLIFHLFKKI